MKIVDIDEFVEYLRKYAKQIVASLDSGAQVSPSAAGVIAVGFQMLDSYLSGLDGYEQGVLPSSWKNALPKELAPEEQSDSTECDECHKLIPDSEPSMANAAHDEACSLFESDPKADLAMLKMLRR